MYRVKTDISATDPYIPHNRVRGTNNNKETRPSVMGNAKATIPAFPPIRGDLLKTCLKEV